MSVSYDVRTISYIPNTINNQLAMRISVNTYVRLESLLVFFEEPSFWYDAFGGSP